MARASVPDASWTPSWGSVSGVSHWEETLGKTQDMLKGLCLPMNASVFPRRSKRKCLGREKSGHLCLDCCPRDPAPDKQKIMDGYHFVVYVKLGGCFLF